MDGWQMDPKKVEKCLSIELTQLSRRALTWSHDDADADADADWRIAAVIDWAIRA